MSVQIVERKRFRCGTKRPGTFAVFPVDGCWLANWNLDLSKIIEKVSARTRTEAISIMSKKGYAEESIWAIEVVSQDRIIPVM
jgi:hypothetical protein